MSRPRQHFTIDSSDKRTALVHLCALLLADSDRPKSASQCVTATLPPVSTGELSLAPCNGGTGQKWTLGAAGEGSVRLTSLPDWGWVSEKDTSVGETVWMFNVPSAKGYCDANHNCMWGQLR